MSSTNSQTEQEQDLLAARRQWMAVLARASQAELQEVLRQVDLVPGFSWLRKPETGLVMVRGRMEAVGDAFNFIEATLTRAALRLDSGVVGYSFALGRDRAHAELSALLDALLVGQAPGVRPMVDALAERQASVRLAKSRRAATTKVEFFAVAREGNLA